jgi:hypothetical protein
MGENPYTVALLNIEAPGSRIVGGNRREFPIILGSFPLRKDH